MIPKKQDARFENPPIMILSKKSSQIMDAMDKASETERKHWKVVDTYDWASFTKEDIQNILDENPYLLIQRRASAENR
jgi:hypothetical protein